MRGLIHVGAHVGKEYLGERKRPLLLFEPQRRAFERLWANFGGYRNVTLVNLALGAQAKRATMHTCINHDQSSSLLVPREHLKVFPDYRFEGTEEVEVRTLDAYMASLNGTRGLYDELVIDAQGYELEVLTGAVWTLDQIRRIRCEVSTTEMFEGCALVEQVDDFLASRGFRPRETELHGPGRSWGDCYYERVP